ncbi:MAG TPA: hypothetical protein P5319_04445 [Gemmatimonadales bacterium]|nr:hypothetical protein [Gemmatimonadales bacterium]
MLGVAEGDVISIRFVSFTAEYVQGLRVSAQHCQVSVERITGKELVFWTDTAPEQVRLTIIEAKGPAALTFINVWKDRQHKTMLYALTSSAMHVAHSEAGAMLLRCSDGSGQPNFEDLVVQVTRESGSLCRSQANPNGRP